MVATYLFALQMFLLGNALTSGFHRVCYYTNWSQYRPGVGAFTPADIDPQLCTHIVFAFAGLNKKGLTTVEPNDELLYLAVNGLKSSNPALKTLLGVGGWSMGSRPFSKLVGRKKKIQKFARSTVRFLRAHGFDGLDIDWEYPGSRGGRPSDKRNYVTLLKVLRKEFKNEAKSTERPELLLTAAVASGKEFIDKGYDIPAIHPFLDFVSLMSYDYHGSWEDFTGHHTALSPRVGESAFRRMLNVQWSAKYWVSNGMPAKKLVVGLATHARTYTLSDPVNSNLGAPVSGPGDNGTITNWPGFIAQYEVCEMIANNLGTREWSSEHNVPYYVAGNQWIAYEDEESFRIKLEWIRDQNYGGAMVWSLDLDDFRQSCSLSASPYPLVSLMSELLTDSVIAPGAESVKFEPEKLEDDFCTGKADGYHTDPTDCSKYFRCLGGRSFHMSCGALFFNDDINSCDYPDNVQCGQV